VSAPVWHPRGLGALWFLSGASSSICRLVWVRTFGEALGDDVAAIAVVSALFVAGLALGGALAGRIVDGRHAERESWPLWAYGYASLVVALSSVLAAFVVPRLGPLCAELAGYVVDAQGWASPAPARRGLVYLAAIVLLGPATCAMGASMVLWVRLRASATVHETARSVAAVYGASLAGAAAGCLAVDLLLVPRLGVWGTQLVAVAMDLVIAAVALSVARRLAETPRSDTAHPLGEATPPRGAVAVAVAVHAPHDQAYTGHATRAALATAALALAGAAGMGLQAVWFRHLIAMLRGQRLTYALILAAILLGTWMGAHLAGVLERRGVRAHRGWLWAQALLVPATLLGLWSLLGYDADSADLELRRLLPAGAGWAWSLLGAGLFVGPILQVVMAPALALGTLYPLAHAHLRALGGAVGRVAGRLYLAYLGGVALGALLTGLVLLPALGMYGTTVALCALAVLALVPLALAAEAPSSGRWRPLGVSAAVLVTFVVLVPRDDLLLRTIPMRAGYEKVLAVHEGVRDTVLVTERSRMHRRLMANGASLSGTNDYSQRYLRLLAHLPLLSARSPARVLVGGYGVGSTLRSALTHPVSGVALVEPSRQVLAAAPWFTSAAGDALGDPRVEVYVDDVRSHLAQAPRESYDVIVLHPPPADHAGTARWYAAEGLRAAHAGLAPGGVVALWLPARQLTDDMMRAVVRTFLDVFPQGLAFAGTSIDLILIGRRGGGLEVDPAAWVQVLSERPAAAQDLAEVHIEDISELLGAFLGAPSTLTRESRSALPITDDHPTLEYETALFAPRRMLPEGMFDATRLLEVCPRCAAVPDLLRYLELAQLYYASDQFLEPRAPLEPELRARRKRVALPTDEASKALIRRSTYLRSILAQRPTRTPGRPAPPDLASSGAAATTSSTARDLAPP
jgi:spermidine synthase